MTPAQNETVAQRQRRLAKEYAESNASLSACNAAARRDEERLRRTVSDHARIAVEAVTRAFGAAPDPVKKDK